MNILQKYYEYVFSLSKQDFIKLALGINALVASIGILFIYLFFNQKHTLIRELNSIYKQRNEAQRLIEQNNNIKKQKEIVSQILQNNANFRLKEFFLSTADSLRLSQYVEFTKLNETEIDNKTVKEISLDAKISNINMQQVTEFLQKIESNERVFIKKLDIKKNAKLPTVDLDLTIATLQLKSEI